LEKQWKIYSNSNTKAIEELEQQLNVDGIIAKLLVQRNIFNYQEASDLEKQTQRHRRYSEPMVTDCAY
jgi:hypothetical protein